MRSESGFVPLAGKGSRWNCFQPLARPILAATAAESSNFLYALCLYTSCHFWFDLWSTFLTACERMRDHQKRVSFLDFWCCQMMLSCQSSGLDHLKWESALYNPRSAALRQFLCPLMDTRSETLDPWGLVSAKELTWTFDWPIHPHNSLPSGDLCYPRWESRSTQYSQEF